MSSAIKSIEGVQAFVSRVALSMSAIGGWCYVVCAFLIGIDVVGRNVVGVTTRATVELSGYLLATGISWGLAGAFVSRVHVRIDVLVEKIPARLRSFFHLLSLLFLLVFAGALAYGAVIVLRDSWDFNAHDISVLSIPLWIPQFFWAFGICVFAAIVLLTTLEVVALLAAQRTGMVNQILRQKTYEEEAAEAIAATESAKSGQ
jgi:TRAP-type C4-dicarboxylate transport system permease small subunit